MRRAAALAVLACLLPAPAYAGPDSIVVFDRGDLPKQATLGSLDVSSRGLLVAVDGNLLDAAGKRQLLTTPYPALSSFVVAHNGTVYTTGADKLGIVGQGVVAETVRLPAPGMQLARGLPGQILIYGGSAAPNNAIYAYSASGSYSKLIEAEAAITAVASSGTSVRFAAGNRIYGFDYGKPLELILVLPKATRVDSLAHDADRDVTYLTARHKLYAADPNGLHLVAYDVDRVGLHDGVLYLLDAGHRQLTRIPRVTTKPRPVPAPPRRRAAALPANATAAAMQQLDRGRQLVARGQWSEARRAYQRASQLAPRWAEPLWALAVMAEREAFYRDPADRDADPRAGDQAAITELRRSLASRVGQAAHRYRQFAGLADPGDSRVATARARAGRLASLRRGLSENPISKPGVRAKWPYGLTQFALRMAIGAHAGPSPDDFRQVAESIGANPDDIGQLELALSLGIFVRLDEKSMLGLDGVINGVRSGTVGTTPSVYLTGMNGLVTLRRELLQATGGGSYSSIYADVGFGFGYYEGEIRSTNGITKLSAPATAGSVGIGFGYYSGRMLGFGLYARGFVAKIGTLNDDLPGLDYDANGVELSGVISFAH